jgi:peptide deformylase
MTVINPEIIEASEEKCLAWEACVSENDRIALVERPKMVKVRFQSVKGVEHDLLCHGLLSRIFQHEIDHFEGKIMEDHAQRYQSTKELEDEVSFEKFRKANKDYIIEF